MLSGETVQHLHRDIQAQRMAKDGTARKKAQEKAASRDAKRRQHRGDRRVHPDAAEVPMISFSAAKSGNHSQQGQGGIFNVSIPYSEDPSQGNSSQQGQPPVAAEEPHAHAYLSVVPEHMTAPEVNRMGKYAPAAVAENRWDAADTQGAVARNRWDARTPLGQPDEYAERVV